MLDTLEKLQDTVKDFTNHNQFQDWLMNVGKSYSGNSKIICTQDNYVSGCTSGVWINGKQTGKTWKFGFYSSTMFTNGIVSIVCEGCNGLTTDQINQVNYTDFDWLATNITLNKKKGLQAMVNHIKDIVNA